MPVRNKTEQNRGATLTPRNGRLVPNFTGLAMRDQERLQLSSAVFTED